MAKQTILTKFMPATDRKGSRIKAVQSGWSEKTECRSVTINYPHEMNSADAHAEAAKQLAALMGWHGRFTQGSLGAQSGFSFVFVVDDGDGFNV